MNTIEHARQELELLGYDLNHLDEDPDKWICENVLELLNVFAKQGHSGFSAPFCIDYFTKLANHEPLTPLTGEDSEWEDRSKESGEPMWQNKRLSRVFKGADGRAYDTKGKVFVEENGCSYTNTNSKVYITFPYTPNTERVPAENRG